MPLTHCTRCAGAVDPGAKFCPNCGAGLTETTPWATVPTPAVPAAQEAGPTLPVTVGGRYTLVELRGGGGMAKVYRALDATLDREVAVKLINPELRADPGFDARFEREARIVSKLHDPGIVVVHDFGLDPARGPYLVMEYLQGQSLRERLASDGPLPFKAALQLAGQVVLALMHAHEHGVVHRDLKPDNIFLITQSGVRLHARLLDFGIARIYRQDAAADEPPLTSPGAAVGTPRYMSPEQLAGRPLDARSDLYSFAVVLHEALTGQLPYVAGRLTDLCPEATPAVEQLLDECLKPHPGDRPPSAAEVYLRLQELGKASGVLLLPPGAMDKIIAARRASREREEAPTVAHPVPANPWVLRGLIAAVALLTGLVLLVVWKLFVAAG